MNEQAMPYAGGQPDFLSLVNAEVEKVEPVIKASPTSQEEQPPSLVPHESLPTPTERPKEVQHLKASNFTEPTLPIDWLSQSVQDYIRTVAESYGCPQDFVVSICLTTAGIARGDSHTYHFISERITFVKIDEHFLVFRNDFFAPHLLLLIVFR